MSRVVVTGELLVDLDICIQGIAEDYWFLSGSRVYRRQSIEGKVTHENNHGNRKREWWKVIAGGGKRNDYTRKESFDLDFGYNTWTWNKLVGSI